MLSSVLASVEARPRRWVLGAALAAVLLRFPGALRPLRPDEAGFLLVARSWSPRPDSLYGPYFVDRPPELLALVRVADAVGGPYAVRTLGAVAAAALVLLAAWCTGLLAARSRTPLPPGRVARARVGVAVVAAALVATPLLDAVAVKGEVLGIVLVLGAGGCALAALGSPDRSPTPRRAALLAVAAGLLASLAVGLKQSVVGGLVLGGVLLLVELVRAVRVRHRVRWGPGAVLGLGVLAAVGALVPVVATVAWALAAGVHLDVLWYAVVGFRGDSTEVLARTPSTAPLHRFGQLVVITALNGLMALVLLATVRLPRLFRADPPVTVAVAALLVVDSVGLLLGGSFWTAYLFLLLPGTLLATGLVLVHAPAGRARSAAPRPSTDRAGRPGLAGVLVVLTALSTLVCTASWTVGDLTGTASTPVPELGAAVGAVARPDDTLTVYGGRPDIQLASGLESPYPELWSLPMRTNDPDLADLRALLAGPDGPTWVVQWVSLGAWQGLGEQVAPTLEGRYRTVVSLCDGRRRIWLRDGVDRATPQVSPDFDRC